MKSEREIRDKIDNIKEKLKKVEKLETFDTRSKAIYMDSLKCIIDILLWVIDDRKE